MGIILDLRKMSPKFRHPLIFRALQALRPGEALRLVNDHDPLPIYYRLRYKQNGYFTWEYVERGPVTWQVQIGRVGMSSDS